jgi:preprotein translocase subunit Sec63
MCKKFGMEEAERVFTKFFSETGLVEDQERNFFRKNYPERRRNYYEVLGVPRDSSMEQIQNAYRRLAMKYHPKNNPGNADAEANFLEVSEAYNHLSNELKRRQYDELKFGQIVPSISHDIFEDFFGP